MKISLGTKSISDAFTLVRLIKPESGDFCLRFEQNGIIVFSSDKRRYIRIAIPYDETVSITKVEELYVTLDKTALLDIKDLKFVTISMTEKSALLKAEGGGQSRQAKLPRKSKRSKRLPIPERPITTCIKEINRADFELILRSLSCSAQVKLKSDEEMRINQVYFYGDHSYATSKARYFGTAVKTSKIDFDLSLVGADLPIISAFCLACKDDSISIEEDKNRLYFVASGTKAILALSKISSKKPVFSQEDDAYPISFSLEQEKLSKSISWAMTASQAEGTRRISFKIEGDDLIFFFNKEEISRINCKMKKGHSFDEDINIEYLEHMIGYIDGDVEFSFGHHNSPQVIRLSLDCGTESIKNEEDISVYHFLSTMVKHQ